MKKVFEQILTWFEDTFQDGETEDWYHKKIVNSVVASYTTKAKLKEELSDIITSLQQDQPMPDSTKLIKLWHEDKEMLKEKDFRDDPWRLAYNAFMCGFGRGIAVNKQEQPEVELEKEIARFALNDGTGDNTPTIGETARHFYELGLNARKEE